MTSTPSSSTTARAGKPAGSVTFVGTGPGDPGLLTVRAVEVLAQADVVVLDQLLTADDVARWIRPDAEVVETGFGEDGQPLTTAGRAKLVTRAAKGGRRVARLMDGDPATFNGLAEEALACRKAGVPFEIVPGVSAVSAVPAYAGVPLTTKASRAVHVVTPHDRKVDWSKSTGDDVTVVVLGTPEVVAASLAELAAAALGGAGHQLGPAGRGQRLAVLAEAGLDDLDAGAGPAGDVLGGQQLVQDDDVGLPEHLDGPHGEQARVPRAGAHEGHAARGLVGARGVGGRGGGGHEARSGCLSSDRVDTAVSAVSSGGTGSREMGRTGTGPWATRSAAPSSSSTAASRRPSSAGASAPLPRTPDRD